MAKKEGAEVGGGEQEKPAAGDGLGPVVAAERPFSDMISRWLDDGDRLHETVHAGDQAGGEAAAHPGRWQAFVEETRARAHRHRRVVACGALLAVVLVVVAFRHSARLVSAAAAGDETAHVVVASGPPVGAPPSPAAPPVNHPTGGPPPTTGEPVAAAAGKSAPEATIPAPAAAMAPAATLGAAKATSPGPVAAPAEVAPEAASVARARPSTTVAEDEDKEATGAAPVRRAVGGDSRIAPSEAPATVADAVAAHPGRQAGGGAPVAAVSLPVAPLEGCRSALVRQRARDALANCRQVFAGAPRSADAMVMLARADLLAGKPTETLNLARRAVTVNPRHADAYLLIGTIEQTEGRRHEARSAYETYLQLAPLGAHATDVKAILRTF